MSDFILRNEVTGHRIEQDCVMELSRRDDVVIHAKFTNKDGTACELEGQEALMVIEALLLIARDSRGSAHE